MADDLPEIEIFCAGTHTAMDGRAIAVTPEDLAALAAGYQPGAAPIVVGHPKTDDPAYGWIKSLRVDERGVLLAKPMDVDPAFAAMVNARRFKNVSVKISPDKARLIHVGFLGAAPPAVAGLKPAAFSAGEAGLEFSSPAPAPAWALASAFWRIAALFRGFRDKEIERSGVDTAESLLPAWEIDRLAEIAAEIDAAGAAAQFAAPPQTITETKKEAAVSADDKAAELAAREKALEERERQAATRDALAFAEGLVAAGKLPASLKADAATLIAGLQAAHAAPLAFAAGEKSADAALRDLLAALPVMAPLGVVADKPGPETGDYAFAAPAGAVVKPEKAEMHAKAARLAAEKGVTLIEAYKSLGGK